MSRRGTVLRSALDRFVLHHTDREILTLTGFDDCVMGLATQFTTGSWLLYDRDKIVRRLMADGMDPGEAEEYVAYNIEGAWVSPETPLLFVPFKAKLWR